MNRIEQFYNIQYFKELKGLPEKIVEKEIELEESLGNDLVFSKTKYKRNEKEWTLGKINEWYFLGSNDTGYKVFEDKKLIQLHLKQKFKKANSNKVNNDKLDPSWLGFWTREIETI